MRSVQTTRRPAHRGFSLTELIVVISIIGGLLAITFPVVGVLRGDSKVNATLNTAGMSVDVARQWVKPSEWAKDLASPAAANQDYSGTAALFSPTGEVRIVVNARNARNGGGILLEDLSLNGYADLKGVDFITIPSGGGIAGIRRNGANVSFLAPPFAIAFNGSGHLNHGDTAGLVYYNANADGTYATGADRPGGYNPSEWDGTKNSPNYDASQEKQDLPFEAIECVPAVIVYDVEAFTGEGYTFDGGGSIGLGSAAADWLVENGRVLFFSPHTGTPLYDEGE